MKSISITALRRLTLACLGISIVSVPLIGRLQTLSGERAAELEQVRTSLERNRTDAQSIERELGLSPVTPPSEPVRGIEETYPLAMQYLRGRSAAHLISVQSVAVGNRQIDAKGVALAELTQPITVAGNLRRLPLQVKLQYESLDELHEYLDGFKRHQTVIRGLDVARNQVTLDLLVLGL